MDIPIPFKPKKLVLETKCVKEIRLSVESEWAEPVTGIDPETNEPVCVSMIGSAVAAQVVWK